MRRLAEKLDDAEREAMLEGESRRLCGVPFHTGETLDEESLTELLPPVPRFMMSELLYVKAKATSRLPYGEAEALLRKALRLLSSLHGEPRLCDLRAERLVELKDGLAGALAADDLWACACFFAQAERYDAMEDAIFQTLDALPPAERAVRRAEGSQMLRRAAKASEQALALCGMTAAELRESAHELETHSIS